MLVRALACMRGYIRLCSNFHRAISSQLQLYSHGVVFSRGQPWSKKISIKTHRTSPALHAHDSRQTQFKLVAPIPFHSKWPKGAMTTCKTCFCQLEATLQPVKRTTHGEGGARRWRRNTEDEKAKGRGVNSPVITEGEKRNSEWCFFAIKTHNACLLSNALSSRISSALSSLKKVAVKLSLVYFLFIWIFHHAPLPLWFQRGWPNGSKRLKGHQRGRRRPICWPDKVSSG